MPQDTEDLLARFAKRDRRALARLITLAERGEAPAVPKAAEGKKPLTVGISGSGGAGKSTLVGCLIDHLRSLGKSVAVLACDPQSPVSGGALLGDRIRVAFDPADEDVFFRSMSTRGAQGGVAEAAESARDWLRTFGFDVILIETVGVGQDQIAVRRLVDRLVLLVTPHSGDEVQWEKAGIIEVADVIALNKSDLSGADKVKAQLQSALSLLPETTPPPIVSVVASRGEGIAELWAAVEA